MKVRYADSLIPRRRIFESCPAHPRNAWSTLGPGLVAKLDYFNPGRDSVRGMGLQSVHHFCGMCEHSTYVVDTSEGLMLDAWRAQSPTVAESCTDAGRLRGAAAASTPRSPGYESNLSRAVAFPLQHVLKQVECLAQLIGFVFGYQAHIEQLFY